MSLVWAWHEWRGTPGMSQKAFPSLHCVAHVNSHVIDKAWKYFRPN